MNISYLLYGIFAASMFGLTFAYWKACWVEKQDPGSEKMQEISKLVREGAMVFLAREYKALFKVIVVATIVIYLLNYYYMDNPVLRWAAFSYPIGAIFSALTGYLGMRTATLANCRTTQAATVSLEKALLVAFGGGTVMGTYVGSFVVLGITALLLFYMWLFGGDLATMNQIILPVLLTYGAGGSTVAIFARVGGGIYTKAADVGADIAGKIVAGIPEDDPRNPGVIADNVGDNVGDIAGMGADLFESCAGAIICAMIFGAYYSIELAILPLVLAGAGIIASIFGSFFVRTKEGGNPQTALNMSNFSSLTLMILFAYPIIQYLSPETFISLGASFLRIGIYYSLIIGVVAGALIGFVAQYYTSSDFAPVKSIAKAAESGGGTVVIMGLKVGMLSIFPITAVLAIGMGLAYYFGGIYGVSIAAAGMLSTVASQLAVDAYGPVADNAGGLAEMVGLPKEVRARTDNLDAVGNTTAAMGKGYAIASAALAASCLFVAYEMATGLSAIDLASINGLIGGFIGAAIPFVFSALAFGAVGEAAHDIAMEIARQFREIPGLLAGDPNAHADHRQCVAIATEAAIHKMIIPGLIALLAPILVGFIGGKVMLGGMLVGNLLVGVALACCLSNAGGAWDNAKKYIESGIFGVGNGKGSDMHKAAVIGDTVGDPCKDTAGPSLNILIKLITIVALMIANMI